jgi:hypothetical protein
LQSQFPEEKEKLHGQGHDIQQSLVNRTKVSKLNIQLLHSVTGYELQVYHNCGGNCDMLRLDTIT